mmetsp:Transcript_42387/g.40625  ORF Transcript_42387/g.40625 Transcript_42387/m.40625 type:complete len:105 (-) Transcript_42387:39-353(-)
MASNENSGREQNPQKTIGMAIMEELNKKSLVKPLYSNYEKPIAVQEIEEQRPRFIYLPTEQIMKDLISECALELYHVNQEMKESLESLESKVLITEVNLTTEPS